MAVTQTVLSSRKSLKCSPDRVPNNLLQRIASGESGFTQSAEHSDLHFSPVGGGIAATISKKKKKKTNEEDKELPGLDPATAEAQYLSFRMNSERYSRFTLQPSENGERHAESHAEVNLSDYAADGDTAAEAPGSPSFRPAPLHHSRRTMAFMILGTLMVFLGGYLVGFISHHKPKVESDCGPSSTDEIGVMDAGKPSPTLSWKDVSQLLTSKLSSEAFKKTLNDFDMKSRSAGSEGDMILANRIFDTFKTLGMTPWTDIHYVQLQTPDKSVHLGSGDPYTPGFPSFNHTLFAPTESAGLPKIPAQTITANSATTLLMKIGGPEVDTNSDFKGELKSVVYKLGGSQNITVEVNNVLVNKEIHNVFGVIKGFTDPDRYVVLGAQRDAWGRGYTKATVGTSVVIELAKAFQEMVKKDDFRPRRSIIFASWSAGEFGSVGATEWLEGYMSSLDRSVFTYINLDGVVMGQESFIASASPLLYSLIESTMKEVNMPRKSDSIYQAMGGNNWESRVLRTMSIEDPAYPFLAFAGIPSMCFHFIQSNTQQVVMDQTQHHQAGELRRRGRDVAGALARSVVQVVHVVQAGAVSSQLTDVSPNWLNRARGSYKRAADAIAGAIANTDLTDKESCRILNDRIMKVEHSLLSPYVSVVEAPYRHLLLGRGPHTLAAIAEAQDLKKLRLPLALATWNLQGCANAMAANVWDIDNDI
ncbi:hypothetical protein CCH79_00003985 [Gambusia affinis]|uniref:Peptidase M28 domain-containing protein n=1 Tax=Gambusia affinis TaxID=33528 RepID=A0A315V3S8_GAMAF|nr:hypothetical protein CCH79_00003985 [Gambusia affinis]